MMGPATHQHWSWSHQHGHEARLSGPKEKHNHPNQEPHDHLRPELAEGEPSLWFPWLGKRVGCARETPLAPCSFSLPACWAAAAHSASSSLPPPPPQSLNQQIITLTLQMFNFLLQLHQFCSRRGGRGNKRKQAGSFQINPELL